MKAAYLIWLSGLLLLTPACSTEEISGECKRDGDCQKGFRCSPDYQCLCISDDSCAEDEFCNMSGYCQTYSGCRTDEDCGGAAGSFECVIEQSGNGTCKCHNDDACAEGEFCNLSKGICEIKIGCLDDSDCPDQTNWVCLKNPQTGIGECMCQTDDACQEGETCNKYHYCQPVELCASDADCPSGMQCDTSNGICLCNFTEQTGCAQGQVCNQLGYCQPIPGCYSNEDCVVPNTFCDRETQKCIPIGFCRSSLQCPLEQYCDSNLNQCVDGCSSSDDCPLDKVCSSRACVAGCQADLFCGLMEFCNPSSQCQCAFTESTPYCEACDQLFNKCSGDAWCIIYVNGPDPFSQAGNENYCGPDCTTNQRCPNGFSCNDLIGVSPTDGTCGDSASCNVGTGGCPGGYPCIKGPEEECGFCPCGPAVPNSCPDNSCFLGMMCMATGKPCQSDADCFNVGCVPMEVEGVVQEYGYCLIGRACGLDEGYHCPVTPGCP